MHERQGQFALFASVRGHGGFTLLEMIVAFAMIGLVLAVLPFAYQKLNETVEYRSVVRGVMVEFQRARMQAIRTGQPVSVRLDLRERRFGLGEEPENPLPERLRVELVVADQDISAEGAGVIRFYPDGSATGGSVSIVRDSGQGVRLRVDWLLGRVTQERLGIE